MGNGALGSRWGLKAGLACALVGFGCLAIGAWAARSNSVPGGGMTAEQVADTLDGIIQPQFQKDAGNFGLGRFAIAGHDGVYQLDAEHVPGLKRALQQVDASHHPYSLQFLHCAHKPARFRDSKERINESRFPELEPLTLPGNVPYDNIEVDADKNQRLWDARYQPLVKRSVLSLLPSLRRGQALQRTIGGWLVAMRPVRATKPSCLGCHRGAQPGDTLGVMVYVVGLSAHR
jgi:hypothetical protein